LGEDPLVRLDLLSIRPLRAGLVTALTMQLVLMGIFFANPLYLQVVQGYDAFETGMRMLPVSVMLFVASIGGARIAARVAPRTLVRAGFGIIFVAVIGLLTQIDPDISTVPYLFFLGVLGTGTGLIASQVGNVTQSAVDERARSEVGGLQNTAAQFGSAAGTALIGAIVIAGLSGALGRLVTDNPAISQPVKDQVGVAANAGVEFVNRSQAQTAVDQAGVPAAEADALLNDYEEAQLHALKAGLLAAAIVTLGAIGLTRDLPTTPLSPAATDEPVGGGGPDPEES
ncbi:MAG: MFS transporter, partial [Actinomycetes bacterium]